MYKGDEGVEAYARAWVRTALLIEGRGGPRAGHQCIRWAVVVGRVYLVVHVPDGCVVL